MVYDDYHLLTTFMRAVSRMDQLRSWYRSADLLLNVRARLVGQMIKARHGHALPHQWLQHLSKHRVAYAALVCCPDFDIDVASTAKVSLITGYHGYPWLWGGSTRFAYSEGPRTEVRDRADFLWLSPVHLGC